MEQIRLIDICLAYQELSRIKQPSKRVKAVIAKLEDSICTKIENMTDYRMLPVDTPRGSLRDEK